RQCGACFGGVPVGTGHRLFECGREGEGAVSSYGHVHQFGDGHRTGGGLFTARHGGQEPGQELRYQLSGRCRVALEVVQQGTDVDVRVPVEGAGAELAHVHVPAAVIVCGADVVHCGEEVGFHFGPVHGEGVGELHRSVDVCPGEFGEHASEQVDGGVAGAQDVGHLLCGQNSL